ncbi:hypothetical protein TYRP_004491 [Tyrophagus putrescentiae]|nr:hypothetical protein TYRP_004491 [Tyrophagus putrescentiae]
MLIAVSSISGGGGVHHSKQTATNAQLEPGIDEVSTENAADKLCQERISLRKRWKLALVVGGTVQAEAACSLSVEWIVHAKDFIGHRSKCPQIRFAVVENGIGRRLCSDQFRCHQSSIAASAHFISLKGHLETGGAEAKVADHHPRK